MILALADRRLDDTTEFPGLQGAGWAQVERLAAQIGSGAWPVNLVLVDDAEMAGLNRQYRQLADVTDVLSFSYLLTEGDGPPDLRRHEAHAAKDLWRERPPGGAGAEDAVGELVLAPNFVAERCFARDWPLAAEIPWLLVHGCLHLVGWDHEEPAAREAMLKLEEAILAGERLTHPLRQRS